jgi:hypothetical protein
LTESCSKSEYPGPVVEGVLKALDDDRPDG